MAPTREQVAQAIYGAEVSAARERVSASALAADQLARVLLAAESETDRSAAILLFALAEDLMLGGLKANLNPDVWGDGKSVAGPNGPLGTASNRLMMLQLLYWIRDSTAQDLRRLKAIRNHFAHHPDVAAFSDPKIASWIDALQPWEKPLITHPDFSHFDPGPLSSRQKYLIRAGCAVAQLASDLAVGPAARIHRVDPGDVEGGFDDLLPNTRQVRLLMADVMLRVLGAAAAPTS